MDLSDFYKTKKIGRFEGHSQQVEEETKFLKNIVCDDKIKNVMEIGFNAGHSAETFLSSNKNIKLVSFDIGGHEYLKYGKEFIDKNYPDRHTLIIGNSLKTIPEYYKNNDFKFDLIFIDGGHSYKVAKADILNCYNLSDDKTIVIIDDTINDIKLIKSWNLGPNKAWKESKEKKIINEKGFLDFKMGRGLSWGNYLHR